MVLTGITLDGITLDGTIGDLIIGVIEIDGVGTMEWVGTTDLITGAIILFGILTIIT